MRQLLTKRLFYFIIVLAGCHGAALAADCPTCQTSFGAPHQLDAGSGLVQDVATADFNGDSNIDLITINVATNQVRFLAGDGAGNFAAPVASPLGFTIFQNTFTIAVANFNGDDNLDLAVTNYVGNSVSILLGNGAGAFTPHTSLGIDTHAAGVAVADFNNDGKEDVAVRNNGECDFETGACGSTTVTIFLGNGAGDFAFASSFSAGGAGAPEIMAADFNGDGNIDLVYFSDRDRKFFPVLQLRFGDGAGHFSNPATPLDRHGSFTIGDFNSDGNPDLAAVGLMDETGSVFNTIRTYLGNGHGGFTIVDSPGYAAFFATLSVADFNTDGKPDLLQNNPTVANDGTTFSGYAPLGDGEGKFQVPAPIGEGVEGRALASGDFNNDGKPDLAVANGSLFTLLNATDCSQPIACVDGDVSVTEGNAGTRQVEVTVKLSAPSTVPVTVDFATAEFEEPFHNSAQSGIDFQAASGTITFDPLSTTRTVTLTVFSDTTFELDEPFRVALTGANGAKVVRLPVLATPVVRILNDDPKPASNPVPHASISDATVIEGNAGTTQAFFTVTLSAPLTDYLNLIYRTVDFNAQSGTDYQGVPAVSPHDLWFAPGDTTRTISIKIFGDTVPEGRESFFVELVPQQSVVFDRGTGVGTILDDDSPRDPAAPVVVTEEDSPRAIALDAVLQTIGPFSPVNDNYFGADKRTRISLFARNVNFAPGENPLTTLKVIIRDVDPNANPNTHLPTLEFVGPLAGTDDVTQIIVRLPDDITPVGDKIVSLGLPNNLPSNQAIVTLKPSP